MLSNSNEERLLKPKHNTSSSLSDEATVAIVAEAVSDFRKIASRLIEKQICTEEAPYLETSPEAVALKILRARGETDQLFHGMTTSGGPYIDILLDLFVNEAIDRDVAVSDACIASRAPPTTALRWLGVLEKAGFIQKRHD